MEASTKDIDEQRFDELVAELLSVIEKLAATFKEDWVPPQAP